MKVHKEMNNMRDTTPKLQTKAVPVDIIKPVVVEAPTTARVQELVSKRYRLEKMSRRFNLTAAISRSLDKASLKEAVEYVVESLTYADGHKQNLILNEEELKVRRRSENVKGIMGALIFELKKSGKEVDINMAVRKQIAMRKLNIVGDRLAETLLRRIMDAKAVGIKHLGDKVQFIITKPELLTPEHYETYVTGMDLI